MRSNNISSGSDIRKAVEGGSKKDVMTRNLDVAGIKALKRDVEVLSQISDLRAAAKKDTAPFQYEKHATAERKAARLKLRRLARAEQNLDLEEEAKLKALEQMEMEELIRRKCSDTAQPSLLPVCKYLLEDYVNRLSFEPCQKCQENAFPPRSENGTLLAFTPHPTSSKAKDLDQSTLKGDQKPMRAFCGHWFHYKCLDIWLTTPPFARDCPACGHKIAHPAWPQDPKMLERAWNQKEAARREQSECADLMGF